MGVTRLKQQLKQLADNGGAVDLQPSFKNSRGENGRDDLFLGVRMPQLRKLVRSHLDLDLNQVRRLLHSEIHEQRMAALLILTYQFPRANPSQQEAIYRFYLDNTAWINNPDLVDMTVTHIVGAYLLPRSREPLYRLAASPDLWERRIAIVATLAFIRRDQFGDTLKVADLLLADEHDLIHNTVGRMLGEVGKRDPAQLETFLLPRYKRMPHVMLRSAVETLPESRRQTYMEENP